RNAKSFSGIVQTTLDRDIQRITELVTRAHLARLNGLADQAAVIVMDVPSGEVLAWAGSRDFWADAPGAQVDHARSRRSPGSALKPFVYGLAMERGLLYPDELLLDGPVDYGSYRPGNFSGDFEGLVTTTEALRMSLNIPAVVVLKRIGSDAFRSWLVGSGIRDPNLMREIWGLGSPLGSVEVTLEELLTLYMRIARFGSAQSPVLLRCGESPPAQLLLRPDICAMLWRMMEQPLPGDLPGTLEREARYAPRVCWKTGTSAGYRDAWTVGFNAHYLVGVWVGQDSGSRSPGLTSRNAALPILGAVFRRLPPKDYPDYPDLSQWLKKVRVCADSGMPASNRCPRTIESDMPVQMPLERVCGLSHQPLNNFLCADSAGDWDLAEHRHFPVKNGPTPERAPSGRLTIRSPAANA
ncbi:MAG TPA: penicillin-binding transpeptidase domain-containing protein, partial [Candidatus Hydrogenedentes bacterium]|nr:penicillin-binding transpeptidase domain-containing protein [Candidatus Hydrogenedentota bacterium]